jgi:three-Cys-motif partner protein
VSTRSNHQVAHRFGGVWTEIKLKALADYLKFYQGALRAQQFETWYVDAFAGSGDRHAIVETGGIFEAAPHGFEEQVLEGSARKALKIDPPFAHFWFAEQNKRRAAALGALRHEFPGRDITIRTGEANAELQQLFRSAPWIGGNAWKQRAVVFLDPYGMSVDWSTLKMLAETKRADVWYLFPRAAVVRQLARDLTAVDADKRRRLSQIFGGDDWEEEFYQARPAQAGLFDKAPVTGSDRVATSEQIAAFARKKFATLFGFVSAPLPLTVKSQDQFELYCLSNNPPAFNLINKGVAYVLKKYGGASHRG